jgi:hypothetical protein
MGLQTGTFLFRDFFYRRKLAFGRFQKIANMMNRPVESFLNLRTPGLVSQGI